MRVAVMIDGQNVSPAHAGTILGAAGARGRVDVARVYLDVQQAGGWADLPCLRLVHSGTGKNAADLLLSIDAMELAFGGGFDAMVIASSDGDFVHLARRLREKGVTVVGVGQAKAPAGFRESCHEFVELAPQVSAVRHSSCPVTKVDRQIHALIAEGSTDRAGISLALLGARMHVRHGFEIRTHPDRTWRGYLDARPTLYDLDPRGPNAKVRFRPEGFARPG